MKNHLFTMVGLFTWFNISAQDFKKIEYQFDLGTTITVPYKRTIELYPEFSGHPAGKYRSDFGYFLELLVSYNFSKTIGIKSGLNYNYTTLQINESVGFEESKGTLSFSYIQIPVLGKYRLSDQTPLSLSVGPYFGLLMKARVKGTSYIDLSKLTFSDNSDPLIQQISDIATTKNINTDVKNAYSTLDMGITMQIDYEFNLGRTITGVAFTRFNKGFTNTMKDGQNDFIASNWKNNSLMIGIGIKM
jgi:hypothetical protein